MRSVGWTVARHLAILLILSPVYAAFFVPFWVMNKVHEIIYEIEKIGRERRSKRAFVGSLASSREEKAFDSNEVTCVMPELPDDNPFEEAYQHERKKGVRL